MQDENAGSGRPAATKQVTVNVSSDGGTECPNPCDLLFSSDSEDDEAVRQIRVMDQGSQSQHARVIVQGVPSDGVIDTGADITIIGQELFARVAAAARLRKKNFRKPNKVPRTYDRKTFHLDERRCPVVMVRKDRFCINYRGLNAVTNADTFPLPQMPYRSSLNPRTYKTFRDS